MGKIEQIYGDFLRKKKQKRNPDYKDYFRASSAGSCFKKQWFNQREEEYEQKELDDRVLRLLRLGTIVHADIEKALIEYETEDDIEIITEQEIVLPDIKVIGHLDGAILQKEGNEIVSADIFDVKTCASYKWRMKFGRNKESNPSFNYELQIGTYGLGIQAKYEVDDITLALIWYNKDTSAVKVQEIDALKWTSEAQTYWEECAESIKNIEQADELIPGVDYGVPMMDWECRYCGFTKYCKGV
jgi:hypothetical protein|tara:strand:+ start:35938 stop:36666 length:729 start_codon:yes stop_codon:yes gene_type:complete